MAANAYDPYGQEILGLKDQLETSRKLRESGQTPLKGQMVSGWYVPPSWTEGAANLLRSYLGGKGEKEAEAAIKGVDQRRVAERDAWLGQMPATKQEVMPEGVEGPAQTFKPKTEDYLQWATKGMNIDPATAQMGMTQAGLIEQRDQRQQDLAAKLRDNADSRAEKLQAQRDLFEMGAKQDERMARLAASLRPAPVAPQEKMISVMGPDGMTPTLVPQSQAAGMQPFVGGAAAGKANPVSDAKESNALLDQVEKIGPTATGSGIGSLRDWAAGGVGYATEGAKSGAQMRVLGASLTSKVPKMSGPQSDKDVAMYKEAAGNIADPGTPWEIKQAAIQTIREINNRQLQYAGQSVSSGRTASGQVSSLQDAAAAEIARRQGVK